MTIRNFRAALAASAVGLVMLATGALAETAPGAGERVIAPPAAQPSGGGSSLSTAASGDVSFSSNPAAEACQTAAKIGDFGNTGVYDCTLALARSQFMTTHDLAAIYTDRGVVHMQHRQYGPAKADLDKAISIDPTIGNAYVNRGGTLIALKQYEEAIADIDHGLTLNPDAPEKAYFNRAIAHEKLKDLAAAYADYQKALALNPNWAPVKAELARFSQVGANK